MYQGVLGFASFTEKNLEEEKVGINVVDFSLLVLASTFFFL